MIRAVVLSALLALSLSPLAAQQPNTEALYQEARRLFDALDYERAVVVLDQAIAALQAAPADATRSRTVLMAQRLQPEKRTRIGLAAFAASGLADDGWRLQIAGAGPELALLEEDAASLGVDGAVDLLGFRDDVAQLYRRAGLFLAVHSR